MPISSEWFGISESWTEGGKCFWINVTMAVRMDRWDSVGLRYLVNSPMLVTACNDVYPPSEAGAGGRMMLGTGVIT
jgi:hypothetical protein